MAACSESRMKKEDRWSCGRNTRTTLVQKKQLLPVRQSLSSHAKKKKGRRSRLLILKSRKRRHPRTVYILVIDMLDQRRCWTRGKMPDSITCRALSSAEALAPPKPHVWNLLSCCEAPDTARTCVLCGTSSDAARWFKYRRNDEGDAVAEGLRCSSCVFKASHCSFQWFLDFCDSI